MLSAGIFVIGLSSWQLDTQGGEKFKARSEKRPGRFSSRGWRGGGGAEAGLSRFPSCSIGESDESSESFIHGVRVRKPLGDIRREHDHIASGCIAFGVLSPYSLAEIIFRQHVGAPLTLGVLHRCSFPIALPSGR